MTQVPGNGNGNGNGNKRAVLYARVSTDEQSEKGYSLPTQLEACRKYAEHLGYTVVEELREDYSGAVPIGERPEGKRLMELLKRREADCVIGHQVDRLSRDTVDLLLSVRLWLRAGVEVHSVDIGKIEDENNILLVIKGWQGSDERKKIVERTTRGRNGKVAAGKVVGSNRAPYGYRFIRDPNNKVIGFEIYETEAGIVRLIFRWYVHDRLTMRGIARKLEEMHVPTPGKDGYASRGARGIWSHTIIQTLLDNETYAGVWHYGNRKGAQRQRTPVSEQMAVSVPAIVDRATWDAAQKLRIHNKAMSKRNTRYEYLLRGRIRCGCGSAMTGRGLGDHNSRRYVCVSRTYLKSDCREPSVSAGAIEAQVWDELKNIFRNLKQLKCELLKAQQAEIDAQEPKRDELKAIESNIAHTEKQAAELARALRRTDPDGIVGKSLQADIDKTNALYREQLKRRDDLIAELSSRTLTDEAIGSIIQFARDVRRGIESAEFADRQFAVERLNVQVKVENGRYNASCVLGEWSGEVLRKGEIIAASNRRRSKSRGLIVSDTFQSILHNQQQVNYTFNLAALRTILAPQLAPA